MARFLPHHLHTRRMNGDECRVQNAVGADHSQQSQCHKPVQLYLYPVQLAMLSKHTLTDSIWF